MKNSVRKGPRYARGATVISKSADISLKSVSEGKRGYLLISGKMKHIGDVESQPRPVFRDRVHGDPPKASLTDSNSEKTVRRFDCSLC